MIQQFYNIFQFATAARRNKKNSNNMESLPLQVDARVGL